MRNNQPVTQQETKVPEGQTLISVTDLKGRITYANKAFIGMSGYTEEELLGQPHNIVRHPDMPAEAFRDMWETIEAGIPWSGVVKNRRKDGGFYWVRANATPVRDGDRIVGYLSVRVGPSQEEIDACEALYATMRAEAAAGKLRHRVHRSKVQLPGLVPWLVRTFTPSVHQQVAWLAFWPAAIPLILMALGLPWWVCALGGAVTILGSFTWIWWLLGKPLYYILAKANRIAAGDLSEMMAVKHSGVMGQLERALAQMSLNVRTVVRDIRHEVGNLRGGTKEIALGNEDMSQRVEAQGSKLEQTAASMEEINGTVKQTSDVTAEGAALATEMLSMARRSHDSVQAVTSTMNGISDSSRRIADIIKVIEGVAFQTNILALNAAVEAARAGEAGRGFAVVAAEVRALAQRTTNAAKEIRQLIEESTQRVNDGSKRAAEALARVDESMEAVNRVATMLDGIRLAASEQLQGTSQIAQTLAHMDDITQQNAAMVEELAAASRSLDDQVDVVHNSIRVFRLFPGDKTLAEDDAVEARKRFKEEHQLKPDEVDFDKVIAAHQQWRVTLRNAALKNKKLEADTIRRDDCCALGKWVYGPGGKRWGTVPVFKDLVKHHKAFHAEAGKVADAINQGNPQRAEQMMESGTPFVEAGHSVTQSIRTLRDMVEGGKVAGTPPAAHAAPSNPTRPSTQTRPPATAAPAAASAPAQRSASSAGQNMPAVRPAAKVPATAHADDDWETF
ncbi:MAG TPA: methyl-accepting chemotaxis protein [Burkholderiaceae bacterium]|nr:methyl-accepting chemotaxis protein [Burkholderiaceae bacterium]